MAKRIPYSNREFSSKPRNKNSQLLSPLSILYPLQYTFNSMEERTSGTNSSLALEFPVVFLQTETTLFQQHHSRFTLLSSKSKTQFPFFPL